MPTNKFGAGPLALIYYVIGRHIHKARYHNKNPSSKLSYIAWPKECGAQYLMRHYT